MFRSYTPKARAKIQLSAYDNTWLDVSRDLVNLTTSKAYGKAAGGWQLTLPRRRLDEYAGLYYHELISPDDVIYIEIDAGDGQGFDKTMTGLVNRVARTITQDQNGNPQRTVKVTGMDMGKKLMQHDAGWKIALSDTNVGPPDINRIAQVGFIFTGTAAHIVEGIFKAMFLSDVTELAKYYKFSANTDDEWQLYNYSINYATGPVWNAMKQAANEEYNILYTDTDEDGVFKVALDKMPIRDDGKLLNIDRTFDGGDIVAEDVGICDDERVNYHFLKAHFSVNGLDNRYPIWHMAPGLLQEDPDSVKRHGAMMRTSETSFGKINLADEATPDFLQQASSRGLALWNRMKDNPTLESGTFTFHLNPRIRVGQGIFHRVEGKEYLVEMVENHLVLPREHIGTNNDYA